MQDEDAWNLEEGFWLNGLAHYASALDPHCVMAFPPPAGIIAGDTILRSLAEAPRWSSVEMSERVTGRPDTRTVVLGYRAKSMRANSSRYEAYCTSTYRHDGTTWKLVQHQQTPVT